MAVNQNHTGNRRGVIIPYGESVLKHCEDVDLSFLQWPEESHLFKGTKRGMLFLTSYRVIFITSHAASDPMLSFMMPFDLLSNCSIEQPVFSPNYIQGTIHAAPDGGWEGQATFKLSFRKGGAIEFGQLLMKAASAASRGVPLRSLTVLVAPGSMMCTSQAPCVAYPVFVYGAPPGYGPQHPGYGPPPPGYGPPPPEIVPSPPGFVPPPPGYGFPPPGFVPPPPEYGPPPEGSEAPPTVYEALPAGSDAPPLEDEPLPVESRARSQKVVVHPAKDETSFPSTSSQANIPPSKK